MTRIAIGLKTAAVAIVVSLVTLLSAPDVAALDCQPYKVIYARGSGQQLIDEEERRVLISNLRNKGLDMVTGFVELDASQMPNSSGLDYPAVNVINLNGPLAVASRGHFGEYAESLNKGKELLLHYLETSNFEACSTRLVLAGYSQGAHVITEALADRRMEKFYPLISFVATFGDPSLDMKTILGGDVFSDIPWYRGNATKYVSGGLVNVRNPYVPAPLRDRVGAWCDEGDMICTGNPLKALSELINKPHSTYPEKAIPEAAAEIATRLQADIKQPMVGPACGIAEQDFMLAVNVSPTMRTDAAFLSDAGIDKTLDGVYDGACDVRVGVVTFGREGQEPTQTLLEPTDNRALVESVLRSLRSAETRAYKVETSSITPALLEAMDTEWRPSAGKAVVLISDGYGRDAVTFDNGTRLDSAAYMAKPETKELIRQSRSHGGVEVYAAMVLHPWMEPYEEASYHFNLYEYIRPVVDATGGRVVEKYGYCGGYCSWREMDFNLYGALTDRPKVATPSLYARAGEEIALRARDISGGILANLAGSASGVSYQWSMECDGATPLSAQGASQYRFTVANAQTCYGAVAVSGMSPGYCAVCYDPTRNNPRWQTPFRLEVVPADHTPQPAPGPIRHLTRRYAPAERTMMLTWQAPENSDAETTAYVVRDEDGNILGATSLTRLSVTGVDSSADIPEVRISAWSEEGGTGPATSSAQARVVLQEPVNPEVPNREGDGFDQGPSEETGPTEGRAQPSQDSFFIRSLSLAQPEVVGHTLGETDAVGERTADLWAKPLYVSADTVAAKEQPGYNLLTTALLALVAITLAYFLAKTAEWKTKR